MSYYRSFIARLNEHEQESMPYSLIAARAFESHLFDGISSDELRDTNLVPVAKYHSVSDEYIAWVTIEVEGDAKVIAACGHSHATEVQNKRTTTRHVSMVSAINCAKAMVAQIRNRLVPTGWLGLTEAVIFDRYKDVDDYQNSWRQGRQLHEKIRDTYSYDKHYTEIINSYIGDVWTPGVERLFHLEDPLKTTVQYHIRPVIIDGRRMFQIITGDGESVSDPMAHRGEAFAMATDMNLKEEQ